MSKKYTLIKTKFVVPHAVTGDIVRSRTLDALLQADQHRLILISAPAGFGKTTALKQWISRIKKKHDVAWLSLDASDDLSDVFLLYFVGALQQVDECLGRSALQYLETANRFDISKTIASLVNDFVDYEKSLFLVLDDFHFIESREIEQFIEVLANLSPSNFHLVLSSRTLPEFPLASGQVNRDVLQLSVADLRFDLTETKSFFESQNIDTFDESQFESLFNKSEGWAAGLHLASLYLSKSDDQRGLVGLAGSLRDIADYLAVEVLDQQPQEIEKFLFRVSILKRFNVDVCNTLLEINNAHQILQEIEGQNLFVVSLDEERNWYRFHHLFQEFLQNRLHAKLPDELPELYRRAAAWFASQQLFSEAVEYALEGKQFDRAAELIEEHTVAEFIRGRMPQVNDWINRVPEETKSAHPRLLILQGTALYHMNSKMEARRISKALDGSIFELAKAGLISDELKQELENENCILQAGILMASDQNQQAIDSMPKTLVTRQKFIEGAANNILAYSYFRLGEFDLSRRYIENARTAHTAIDAKFGVVYCDCFQAMVEISEGNLRGAHAIFKHYDNVSTGELNQQIYVASVADIMLGIIHYEMNELNKAYQYLQICLAKLEEVGHIRLTLLGYAALVRISVNKQDFANAYKLLDYMLLLVGPYPLEEHRIFIGASRIKVCLDDKNPAAALNLATLLHIPLDEETPDFPEKWNEVEFLKRKTQIRILLQAGQYDAVELLFKPLLVYLKTCDQQWHSLEINVLQVRYLCDLGDEARARDLLLNLIRILAPQTMFRLLLDEGEGIHKLLKKILHQSAVKSDVVVLDYVQTCCDYLDSQSASKVAAEQNVDMVEPLSAKEMKILALMAQGKSNAAIAAELFISESTVKWHGGNIFGKLGVRNRTAAVITAKELGVIN